MFFIAVSSLMSKSPLLGGKIAGQKFDRKAIRMLVVLAVLADFAASLTCAGASNTVQDIRLERTSSSQQISSPTRIAEWLGLDAAIARRDSVCISNDLRPECLGRQGGGIETAQLYIDWDRMTKRCFVTMNKPVGRTIVGGGPFQTWAAARAAIKTTKGC